MPNELLEAPEDATRMLPESDYLGAWDLNKKPVTLIIRDVKVARLAGNAVVRKAQDKCLVFFSTADGKPVGKGLLCGATNLKSIISLYGKKWKTWIGKPVTIFPTTCGAQGGAIVDCIRVKPEVPKTPAATVEPSEPVDQEMRAKQIEAAKS
jgi:hypothetical protein